MIRKSFLFFLVMVEMLWSQETTGNLKGRMFSFQDAPLAAVNVTVCSPSLLI